MTGVIAGTVMRINVVKAPAPDIRLASSRDASILRKAGVNSITFVDSPWVIKCAQMIPENE